MDPANNFAVVSMRTASPTCVLLVVNQMEKELDDSEWVIGMLKSQLDAGPAHGNVNSVSLA